MAASGREPAVLDVRKDLMQGRHPLGTVLQAVKRLAGGQDLVLVSTFEPVPLYKVLALRGFDHAARQLPGGDWEVRFVRRRNGTAVRTTQAVPSAPPTIDREHRTLCTGTAPPEAEVAWTRLDNRGLEPPDPMIRTFSAMGEIAPGEVLEIHNDRRPMFLYPHLNERGYSYETVDEPDGSARVRIWKTHGENAE